MKVAEYRLPFVVVGIACATILFSWVYLQNRRAIFTAQSLPALEQEPAGDSDGESMQPTKIPSGVLDTLQARFLDIQPTMREDDVLSALGLDRFNYFLQNNYHFQMDGAGGNHKTYALDDESGYQLEFYDFMGRNPKCMLHAAGVQQVTSAPIGQRVTDMAGFDKYLNPGS